MARKRPPKLFDRTTEWANLVEFATSTTGGLSLGLVYGRRRQGKSFLLSELVHRLGGFYYQALEEERAPALARLGRSMAEERGLGGGTLTFNDWPDALKAVIESPSERSHPRLVVLDEFPYLLAKSPELTSALQEVYDVSHRRSGSPTRLVLCGSALSVMAGLLAGQKALRGRAVLELVFRPFDFRNAAVFWGVAADPELAFLLYCVVGGTPGYRALLELSPPASKDDFDAWLMQGVLNPSHALFREADYLLAEEPTLTDRAIYQSALTAVAVGRTTPGAIAGALSRRETSVTHVIDGLVKAHFLDRSEDVLRSRRPVLRIADPMLRFYHAVIRPDLARFEARQTRVAWHYARPRFESHVVGPAFEAMCRDWTAHYASPSTVGGSHSIVGSTVINDSAGKSQLEIDVAALAPDHQSSPHVLLIGEAKSGAQRPDITDLQRLERARELLATRARAESARLAIFSQGGFARELRTAATRRSDVELIDLERLYTGS